MAGASPVCPPWHGVVTRLNAHGGLELGGATAHAARRAHVAAALADQRERLGEAAITHMLLSTCPVGMT